MKRCPQCHRVETDEALKFCRVDGATLISGSSSIGSEAGTANLGSAPDAGEVHTSILPQNTSANVNRTTLDDSLLELRRAEEIDPRSPIIATNLGDTLVYMHRYDEAIAQYKRILISNPNFALAHVTLGRAYALKGMYPEAIAETRRAAELNFGPTAKGFLGLWLAKSGQRDEALRLLNELKQQATKNYVQGLSIAQIYVGLGDKAEALNWLEKNMLTHAETASSYAATPELDELRNEPRFKAMLKQMNLPE